MKMMIKRFPKTEESEWDNQSDIVELILSDEVEKMLDFPEYEFVFEEYQDDEFFNYDEWRDPESDYDYMNYSDAPEFESFEEMYDDEVDYERS